MTWHLQLLDLSDNSLTASAIQELTKTYWPYLRHLILKCNSTGISAMAQGRWPLLQELDASGGGSGSLSSAGAPN